MPRLQDAQMVIDGRYRGYDDWCVGFTIGGGGICWSRLWWIEFRGPRWDEPRKGGDDWRVLCRTNESQSESGLVAGVSSLTN